VNFLWTLCGDGWNNQGSKSQEPISRDACGRLEGFLWKREFEAWRLELNQGACSLDANDLNKYFQNVSGNKSHSFGDGLYFFRCFSRSRRLFLQENIVARFEKFIEASADPIDQI
jgi:hypothetical protein